MTNPIINQTTESEIDVFNILQNSATSGEMLSSLDISQNNTAQSRKQTNTENSLKTITKESASSASKVRQFNEPVILSNSSRQESPFSTSN